jgi:hypothetical protein
MAVPEPARNSPERWRWLEETDRETREARQIVRAALLFIPIFGTFTPALGCSAITDKGIVWASVAESTSRSRLFGNKGSVDAYRSGISPIRPGMYGQCPCCE